ncbi:MAG: hypothetical protein EZS28_043299 [Streblomastix strix]|uniref:Uncharacterized protein n=1 Tax=Streblomastix strix TaxID=222440 RepID=A0A5J4TS72_9EUKA|nr:MAG: hypothetical protein EZS28_043299 [Streblomastix strix]
MSKQTGQFALSTGCDTQINYVEFAGHLQPDGQFVLEQVHESYSTFVLEGSVHFLSELQVYGGYYACGFESQTQPDGVFGSVQQAGHYPFPALGSSVLKQGQQAAV